MTTIADLRTSRISFAGTVIVADGDTASADGGGGTFVWSDSSAVDDGTTIIVPGGTIGTRGPHWRRVGGTGTAPGGSSASDISVTTTGFAGNLSAADDTVQKALDTIDNIAIPGAPTASGTSTSTASFNGNLSAADDTVQKALDTLDNLNVGGVTVETKYFHDLTKFLDSGVSNPLPTANRAAGFWNDGTYLWIFGGLGAGSNGTVTIWRTSVGTPTSGWAQVANKWLAWGNAWSPVVRIGDYLYIFGGLDDQGVTHNKIQRAPVSDPSSWTDTGATIPAARRTHVVIVVGSYVYIYGGADNSNTYRTTIWSAPVSNPLSWSDTTKTIPVALGLPGYAVVGNWIMFYGGTNGAAQSSIWIANVSDPATVYAMAGIGLLTATFGASVFVADGKVWLFGGNAIQTMWAANVSTPWIMQVVSTTTHPSGEYGSVQWMAPDGWVYLFGGFYGGSTKNQIFKSTARSTASVEVPSNTVIGRPCTLQDGARSVYSNHQLAGHQPWLDSVYASAAFT
jgi:flavin-binding protein dodecin